MPGNNSELEKRLWAAADELRANSNLTASKYSAPVLGLIFLRYADARFIHAQEELEGKATGRRKVSKIDYQAKGILYLPEAARFSTLLNQPEGTNIGKAINDAMSAIEVENEDLRGVLPKTYDLQRGIAENLSEEELAVFELLTRLNLKLNKAERERVREIARQLLDTLKAEYLVLDWRKNQRTRAGVKVVIEEVVDRLPETFTPGLYEEKCEVVYQHVFDSYFGAGKSVYLSTI